MEREKMKEIKKSLERCAIHDCSDSCIFSEKHPFACLTEMHKQLLTLIDELEGEIANLYIINSNLEMDIELLKQFAEMLKEELKGIVGANFIDKTLKEFINKKKE